MNSFESVLCYWCSQWNWYENNDIKFNKYPWFYTAAPPYKRDQKYPKQTNATTYGETKTHGKSVATHTLANWPRHYRRNVGVFIHMYICGLWRNSRGQIYQQRQRPSGVNIFHQILNDFDWFFGNGLNTGTRAAFYPLCCVFLVATYYAKNISTLVVVSRSKSLFLWFQHTLTGSGQQWLRPSFFPNLSTKCIPCRRCRRSRHTLEHAPFSSTLSRRYLHKCQYVLASYNVEVGSTYSDFGYTKMFFKYYRQLISIQNFNVLRR